MYNFVPRGEEQGRFVAMNIDPAWPEWAVRQRNAIVWVQAPTAEAAVETAARKVGPMGGWNRGPAIEQEVFARSEYREHAKPGDYMRSVIIAPEKIGSGRIAPR